MSGLVSQFCLSYHPLRVERGGIGIQNIGTKSQSSSKPSENDSISLLGPFTVYSAYRRGRIQ